MKNFHQDLLDKFHNIKEGKRNSTLEFFSLDSKKMKPAPKLYQKQFKDLVARWTSCSLRPFSTSEDKELQNVAKCARKRLIVPESKIKYSFITIKTIWLKI